MVAVAAFPTKAPVNVVEVTDVSPAIVVADDPKLIAVLPTVTELFAKLAFVIPAVPLKLALVSPEIEPPKVIVPEVVIVPPVSVIPDTDPAVATEVTVPDPPAVVVKILPAESNANNPTAVPGNDDTLV